MSSISLDSDALKAVIAQEILKTITPEDREKLMAQALVMLMSTEKDYNGRPKGSPLEQAFNEQARIALNRMAREMLEADETFNANCRSMIVDVSNRIFDSEIRDSVVTKIVDTIVTVMR